METVVSVFLSGIVSLIVTILVAEYRFIKRDLHSWHDDIFSLVAEIESNINKDDAKICNISDQWRKKILELNDNHPESANKDILEDLDLLLEKCESMSNMNPNIGGYNKEVNKKKDEIENISQGIKENIQPDTTLPCVTAVASWILSVRRQFSWSLS